MLALLLRCLFWRVCPLFKAQVIGLSLAISTSETRLFIYSDEQVNCNRHYSSCTAQLSRLPRVTWFWSHVLFDSNAPPMRHTRFDQLRRWTLSRRLVTLFQQHSQQELINYITKLLFNLKINFYVDRSQLGNQILEHVRQRNLFNMRRALTGAARPHFSRDFGVEREVAWRAQSRDD